MGILKQLITTESTEQKGTRIIIFTPSRGSHVPRAWGVGDFATTGTRYRAIWIWIIFMHSKYSFDWKYLFEVKLKHFSSALSPLNVFLRYSICSRQKCIDICERCNALKRHQALAEAMCGFSEGRLNGEDAINKHFWKLWAWGWFSRFSENKSAHLRPYVSYKMAELLHTQLPPLLLLKQSN